MQAGVVEPGDVADDRDLEVAAAGPGSVGDELGLEGVDEALGGRVDAPIAVKSELGRVSV